MSLPILPTTVIGNYQLKKLFSGEYAELFPAILDVHADQISREFMPRDRAYAKLKAMVAGTGIVRREP